MIRQYELIDKIQQFNKNADVALLNRAYVYSMKAHGNQKRVSGEPYLIHPLEVASIIADLHLDDASIAAALLHDTIEDTLATTEELESLFGKEVAEIVEGVTKLSKLEFTNKQKEQAENYRKLFLAMSKDIRVLLIKVADRLHNMRTLHCIPKPEKRRRIAQDTMDIFVPLAERVGLYAIKTELEEIAFKELQPEAYERISERLKSYREQDNLIGRVLEALQEELEEEGIECEVKGREKAIPSIHKKMVKKNLTFDQLTDIVAYRVIVKDKVSCYEVLGKIHDIYKAIPGRFKDYISNQKPNGYQSLHTSVIGPFGNRMEIQIRDKEMDEIAESGVAAHWLYKQQTGVVNTEGMQYKWLKGLMETLQDSADAEEFIENAKMDLFDDQVFVFSPKGDLVTLPKGSTPLDFAYNVHSEVGNKCQTAKINGRVAPLRTRLRNGDQVDIVTSKNQQPTRGWLNLVITGKARSAINRFLRLQERDELVRLGREMLEKAARRESLSYTEKSLSSQVLKELKMDSIDDVYVGVAQGHAFPRQVFDILFPDRHAEQNSTNEIEDVKTSSTSKPKFERRDTRVAIDGLTPGMAIYIAKCCNPLPGEDIVGIINTGRGISIHSSLCKNLDALSDQPERWLDVRWNGDVVNESADSLFVARLRVETMNEKGVLSLFSTAIYNAEANIEDLFIENKNKDHCTIRVDVEVSNLGHLERVVEAVKNLRSVTDVERLTN
ncbi:MAG: bifunctional (p)ppGpp synthetase/guanosine-3',5'-bis(diphosphate) 3'-pyrophosphohydrolase [Magnetococcales bacterium]|nr:bifunctional (p)ppGpp synthetase/guanosine-3',5'-bis(diphosphate) 3'-pyrophosphohydrolase [Magnetococcales bacterium]